MRKLTDKQEKFCQKYVEVSVASDAYRFAYNCDRMKIESVHRQACELLKNIKVASRIDELKANAAKRNEITVDDLVKELEESRDLAKELEKPEAMNSATMGKAKLLGLVVDKKKLSGDEENPIVISEIKRVIVDG